LSFSLSFEREKRRERSVKSGSFCLLFSLFFVFALDSFSSVNTERERVYEGIIIVKIPRDGFCVAALGTTTEATNFGRVTVSVPRLRVEAKSELGRFTSRWGRGGLFGGRSVGEIRGASGTPHVSDA